MYTVVSVKEKCMNVGQLKKLLSKIDDDIPVVNQISMEQGRGCNGGMDECPSIDLCKPGEVEHSFMDECGPDDDDWEYDEDGGYYTNKETWLVINGSCDEDWYQ